MKPSEEIHQEIIQAAADDPNRRVGQGPNEEHRWTGLLRWIDAHFSRCAEHAPQPFPDWSELLKCGEAIQLLRGRLCASDGLPLNEVMDHFGDGTDYTEEAAQLARYFARKAPEENSNHETELYELQSALDASRIETKRWKEENCTLRQQLTVAKEELEREYRSCSDTIDQRDRFEEQINQIADALGDDTEWSNCNDRGKNAIELSAQLTEDFEECRRQLATQTTTADQLFVAKGQAETELARVTSQLTSAREALESIAKLSRNLLESAKYLPKWHEMQVRRILATAALEKP